jgi:acyl-[acyl-carrier-protein]-phospholipid O-acyltransferase/long-chain-fatty-acid--[acyl-carrier-protein] ligase
MTSLLKIRGALAFLAVVFLNTIVDLGHKIVIQNTIFKVHDGSEQVVLTALVNGLILLPFILMFSLAGFVSDKYPKSTVMRASAWVALGLTLAITGFYSLGWFWAALAMTFLLAVQSAFYSPAKLAYIKFLFGKQHLAAANGLVQAVAILGILLGTLIFSILFEFWFADSLSTKVAIIQSLVPVGLILVMTSVAELVVVYRIPQLDSADERQHFDVEAYRKGRLARTNIQPIFNNSVIALSIFGLAIFWSIGQVMLASFPAFAKAQTGETNTIVIQAILAASGLGIAIGSVVAAKYSRNYIETGLIPVGAAGVTLGLFVLPNLSSPLFMGLDFLFIGAMGGMFIVPLNALIQFHANEQELGRILAGNNLLQNLAMLVFLLITVAFALSGISSKYMLALIAVVALAGFVFTVYKIPQSLVRFVVANILSFRYKVRVIGMKNIPAQGGVLFLGNHISWIDWAIIQIASPRPVRFVMIRNIYERWYLKWFFDLFGCIPIEPGARSKESLEKVAELLNNGEVVCLFPEGTISRNGHLTEFKRGYEKSLKAANNDVCIVPFYLRGLWGSQFSRSSERLKSMRKTRSRRELLVAFGEQLEKNTDAEVLKRRVFDLSIHAWAKYSQTMPSLAEAWINTVKKTPVDDAIIDTLSGPLSSTKALASARLFSKRIAKLSPEQNIAVLLPTSAGGVITNMAVLLAGKTVVNLNYTSSNQALASALEQAQIKTVYSSSRFLEKLKRRGIDFSAELSDVNVVDVETIKQQLKRFEALATFVAARYLPASILCRLFCKRVAADSTAAILFSSGSEGAPKGIELSHQNIMANAKQVAEVLNAEGDDVVMASLPLFHAFGLTVTQFMPLIEGLPMVCHADPTDSLGVAKAVAKYQATIMCGTSSFLRFYCRDNKVKPLMLESLRVVVSGAEKLNPDVREAFKLKFGKEVYEGYGATETSPVASVNLPDILDTVSWKIQAGAKQGSVGMPLPGTSFKIVDPESLEELPTGEQGMILIGGPQIMKGYFRDAAKTEQVILTMSGVRWYISGDKGYLDEDGFLVIVDRYSRFAKLGGEMISLAQVEQNIRECLDTFDENQNIDIVAVNVPDEKKGEQIVLLCDKEIELNMLRTKMLENGAQSLTIPARIIVLDVLPKLGSGKTDFVGAKKIATATS